MRRSRALIALFSVALTACAQSGGQLPEDSVTVQSTAAVLDPVTTTDDDAPTTTVTSAAPTTSGRPIAPDFTLELGEGGTYTLSETDKPVYLVFWAEW